MGRLPKRKHAFCGICGKEVEWEDRIPWCTGCSLPEDECQCEVKA